MGRKMISPDQTRKWLKPELKCYKKSKDLGNIWGKNTKKNSNNNWPLFIDPDPAVGKEELVLARG